MEKFSSYFQAKSTEHRISKLEVDSLDLRANLNTLTNIISSVGEMVADLSSEMKEFKDEMKEDRKKRDEEMLAFKDEMKEFKDEMLAFKDEMKEDRKKRDEEMLAFKDEMKEFKDEMLAFKEESRTFKKEMNKKWGDLANKMGTIVEDIVYPSISGVAKRYFGVKEVLFRARNVRKKLKQENYFKEFDVILEAESFVLLNETKSSPNAEKVKEFSDFKERGEFLVFFPEHTGKTIHYVFSSLHIEPELVDLCSSLGIYAMAMGEDTMEILNMDGVGQKEFV